MKKTIFIPIFIFHLSLTLYSQKYTISGFITDSISNENILFANIIVENTNYYTTTNQNGFYSLSLPKNKYKIIYLFAGYSPYILEIEPIQDTTINIRLSKSDIVIEEVVVKAENKKINQIYTDLNKIEKLPVLTGEKDIFKSLQFTPGITQGTEGSSNLYIRGSSADQNLILLDGVPVYNSNHLFGFFSVFNTDALKNVNIYKGGIPAQFSGRASSVIDIYMKDGNMNKTTGEISIGLISSKILLEGPIIKNKFSYIITARRTFLDLLFYPFSKSIADNSLTGFYFYDANIKLNYKISDKNRFFISFYSGKDRGFMKYKNENKTSEYFKKEEEYQNLQWGNHTFAIRYQSTFSKKITFNSNLIFSNFNFSTENNFYKLYIIPPVDSVEKNYNYLNSSGIKDFGGKINFDYYVNNANSIKLGINITEHYYFPSFTSEYFEDTDNDYFIEKTTANDTLNATEISVYLQDEIKLSDFLKLNLGINANSFYINKKLYKFVEPRFFLDFKISEKTNLQVSYSNINQYIHLLTNSSLNMPTDLWVPVTENIKPINSNIYDFGILHSFNEKYTSTLSCYYKTLKNLIQYKQGIIIFSTDEDWQQKITTGKGYTYGVEIALEKKTGKITGWLSYTYSRSLRKFQEINSANVFPYKYDRPHNFNLVINYKYSEKLFLSLDFVIMSGHVVTFAKQNFAGIEIDGTPYNPFPYIDYFNNLRFPIYHRADISFTYQKQKNNTQRFWFFGIYNFYNRRNPYFLKPYNTKLIGVCYFPFLPFVSYSIKF